MATIRPYNRRKPLPEIFYCLICKKNFKSAELHVAEIHECCDEVAQEFIRASSRKKLKQTFQLLHSKGPATTCPFCLMPNNKDVEKHIAKVHLYPSFFQDSSEDSSEDDDLRLTRCRFCFTIIPLKEFRKKSHMCKKKMKKIECKKRKDKRVPRPATIYCDRLVDSSESDFNSHDDSNYYDTDEEIEENHDGDCENEK